MLTIVNTSCNNAYSMIGSLQAILDFSGTVNNQLRVPDMDIRPYVRHNGYYDVVCVAGGDGTVASLVNQIAAEQLSTSTPIIVCPSGRYNSVAASLGIRGVEQVLSAFVRGTPKHLYVWKVSSGNVPIRYALSAFAIGTAAEIMICSNWVSRIGHKLYLPLKFVSSHSFSACTE